MRKYMNDLSTKEPLLGEKTLPLGFAGFTLINRIVGVCGPASSAAKRLRQIAEKENRLIDMRHGRKTRAVLITDSNHVILSAVSCETLQGRLEAMGHED